MSNKVVLVTGGAGYIGSHACKALHRAGFTPVALDNLVNGHRWAVRWGPLEVADVRDRPQVEAVLRRYRPAAVIHFAGFAYVGESMSEPGKYYDNNITGALTLLAAMHACEVNKLVFSSTCATYGIPDQLPIREETPQRPINPYGHTKLMIEQAIRDYSAAYGLRGVSLRYFNAAGADEEGEIGELHEPETHLIPRALMAVTGSLPALEVFGTDLDTHDGTCVRDFIHVADLAAGHVDAVRYLLAGGESACVNLGTGRGISVREIIASVERITGRRVPVKFSPPRAGDPPILVADPTRAGALIGFKPRYTQIDAVVESAWRWHCRLEEDARGPRGRAPVKVFA